MLKPVRMLMLVSTGCLCATLCLGQEKTATTSTPDKQAGEQTAKPQAAQVPATEEWGDDFNGKELDTEKWERFTFEGGSGGKIKVEDGQLRQRGTGNSRSGSRSKAAFSGDRFIVEGVVTKVGEALPVPDAKGLPIGNAILTLLFDTAGRNRVEWLLTSEHTFEAWAIVDGRGERLDNRKLGTKTANPTLSIARRGDEFFFALNGQVGLQKSIKNLPGSFHVMLYGFGSSENNWDSVRVVVPKAQK